MTYFDAQTEIRRENEEAKAPVDSMVILDHLAYLAYHLYTLDALSRCTYPLRWGVLRADLRAEFMERAAIAYRMWHDSECESRADWEVLEKLEADTLRFMVVDLQSGIEQIDALTRQRDILAEAIQKALHDPYCADCSPTCEIQKECPTWLLSQALKDAGMGRNDDTRRIAEILWYR